MVALTSNYDSLGLLASEFHRKSFRTMRDFAEQEIYIPSGPFMGSKFSCERQPFTNHWFDAVDSGNWIEFVITGPSQSGKSLIGFCIPVLYYAFEMIQDVIPAVPTLDMVADKWRKDLLPVIERTRYRDLMPDSGIGSKGGRGPTVAFQSGVELKWMTGGGRDKARAGYTSPIMCMTETDGFDETATTSDETSKIGQIEARSQSFPDDQRRLFKECTVSTTEKHTWDKYKNQSTTSRVMLKCWSCGDWGVPEREHLKGWQNADNEIEAAENARFHCPSCDEPWTENQRWEANKNSLLIHKGQRIENDEVVGDLPPTKTLGFRWTAVHNLLKPTKDYGRAEYLAQFAKNPELEERRQKQFNFCIPIEQEVESLELDERAIQRRIGRYGRGEIPTDSSYVTLGVDIGKRLNHWTAMAWEKNGVGHVIDYGRFENASDDMAFAKAVLISLRDFRENIGAGWTHRDYSLTYVDARYKTKDVCQAIKKLKDKRWRPFQGFGSGNFRRRIYTQPEKYSKTISHLGDQFYEQFVQDHGCIICKCDSNDWKTRLHESLSNFYQGKETTAGGIVLFDSMNPNEHVSYVKHLTAEKQKLTFEHGKGWLQTWDAIRSSNHWLDSTYMAMVAAFRCGFRFHKPETTSAASDAEQTQTENESTDWSEQYADYGYEYEN